MKKTVGWVTLTGLLLLVGIQFIPVGRTNPPVTGEIPAPAEIKTLLRDGCYNCHSHETVWPWYSHVAPVSWLIASDVRNGRRKMNLSTWADYKLAKQGMLLDNAAEEIGEGDMPPFYYAWMHPNARLTDAQKKQLTSWMDAVPRE